MRLIRSCIRVQSQLQRRSPFSSGGHANFPHQLWSSPRLFLLGIQVQQNCLQNSRGVSVISGRPSML